MAKVGIDFGTGNTVMAVFNQNLGRAETLEIPGITARMTYRLTPTPLTVDDLTAVADLAQRILHGSDPLSNLLRSQLPADCLTLLNGATWQEDGNAKIREMLVDHLNRIIVQLSTRPDNEQDWADRLGFDLGQQAAQATASWALHRLFQKTTGFANGGRIGEQVVHVIPSMIHYGETETLIGNQVLSRGLAEHEHTFRWMKRAIGQGNPRRRKTAQGSKSAQEAGTEFVTLLLNYAAARFDFENDEFTFTAPTESFEHFQDWLRTLAESVGIRRLRLLDEPTACVLGYHGTARPNDHFAVFDFGCGTLDVSVVKLDLASAEDRKAIQLGQAGRELGGMDIDQWIAEDFCRRHGIADGARRELDALILREAEAAKIALSDPAQNEAEVTVLSRRANAMRSYRTVYRRACRNCAPREQKLGTDESCLGCLLTERKFLSHSRETLARALELAAIKAGLSKDQIVRVLVTGGTSLVPCVGTMLHAEFNGRVEFQSSFDAVARGACRGIVVPILQHDYAIEGYNREKQAHVFTPLFKVGTEYPTESEVRLWVRGTYDGQVRVGLKIFEVSRMLRAKLDTSLVDGQGILRTDSKVTTDFAYACLNPNSVTFIVADPPVLLERDKQRFLASFSVDGQRRLLVTVKDHHAGKHAFTLDAHGNRRDLVDYPVVRL